MKICKTENGDPQATAVLDCIQGNGLPYLIIIVTLVLCSLLLATIALIIVIVVIRQKKKARSDSVHDESIAYDELGKPETRAMEVQPDLRTLEPRADPRAFMPFAPIPTRRYTALPFESQRRLIPVPEEEGSADERLTSPEEIFAFPVYEMDVDTYDADSDFAQSTFPPEVGEAVNAKPDGNT
ncbi:uncharacterized protein LOC112575627 isoform X1 [Pomacea canaliculata]|uniref:uncharacterized protein LOC112575627 isoform X1 n=1 Tax=Pomacea canaliculata TaxID=400727 RepID=UPI000D7341AE|nr:uncharacterized protein LOC112575627 isoform X1 [Pomacea canaliculata]XP_025113389.1 uncharacterized protein LOC112575627 isoform X1 [Pomacea canaliculata]